MKFDKTTQKVLDDQKARLNTQAERNILEWLMDMDCNKNAISLFVMRQIKEENGIVRVVINIGRGKWNTNPWLNGRTPMNIIPQNKHQWVDISVKASSIEAGDFSELEQSLKSYLS